MGVICRVEKKQGCGSGSGLDPDSIGSVDPDSESGIWIRNPESGSGSRRAKIPTKVEKNLKISCFEVLDASFES
jgi:hypothetical protein